MDAENLEVGCPECGATAGVVEEVLICSECSPVEYSEKVEPAIEALLLKLRATP